MPSSAPETISPMARAILRVAPTSVLDLGVGYGKYGLLVRELCEAWKDRVFPSQWAVRLDGVEGCRDYVERLPWLAAIYSRLIVADLAMDEWLTLGRYDLVILGDVVEHLEEHAARALLRAAWGRAKRALLVSLPIGDWTGNVVVAGNDLERHRSVWTVALAEDALRAPCATREVLAVGKRTVAVLTWER